MVQVKWTGAAGLEFFYKGKSYLIDPYYTRLRKRFLLFGKVKPDKDRVKKCIESIKNISSIIVSHTHFDHALDLPEIAEYYQGKFYGSKSLQILMELHNINERVFVCKGGEEFEPGGDISLKMIASQHGLVVMGRVPYQGEINPDSDIPMKIDRYAVGQVFAPLLSLGDKRFLHIGSANFIEEQISGNKCDVLFFCVPGWKKIYNYPERIIELTNPDTVVLFHFDDFFTPVKKRGATKNLPFLDMKGVIDRIKNTNSNIDIIKPEINQIIKF